MNYEWLERWLSSLKPYSKGYLIVKRVVTSWGHWKPLPRGGSFKKGPDARRSRQKGAE